MHFEGERKGEGKGKVEER